MSPPLGSIPGFPSKVDVIMPSMFPPHLFSFFFKEDIYLFIWPTEIFVAAHRIAHLYCGLQVLLVAACVLLGVAVGSSSLTMN